MIEIERYQLALDYAVNCFKSKAMTMTSDQLSSDIKDIVGGTANWNKSKRRLEYDFIEDTKEVKR